MFFSCLGFSPFAPSWVIFYNILLPIRKPAGAAFRGVLGGFCSFLGVFGYG